MDLDNINHIAILEPDGELTSQDFEKASKLIDPMIEETGKLSGLIIHTKSFPGWDSFGAFLSHMRFVKDHHQKISHVALVTDSSLGGFGEKVASHFISAEVKNFDFNQLEQARRWIVS